MMDKSVADAFSRFPDDIRDELTFIRNLIIETAEGTPDTGNIVETLKWGQPSYLTERPKSGTTIRLGMSKDNCPAMFVHCQTSLITEYRLMFEDLFDFDGNRAMILKDPASEQKDALAFCIARALTYHQR